MYRNTNNIIPLYKLENNDYSIIIIQRFLVINSKGENQRECLLEVKLEERGGILQDLGERREAFSTEVTPFAEAIDIDYVVCNISPRSCKYLKTKLRFQFLLLLCDLSPQLQVFKV